MPREYYVYPDGTPIAIAGNNEYATQIPMSASDATDVYTAINAKVDSSGDTMTGPLILSGTQVQRAGGNTSWINGRDVAPVKTTSGGGAWNPVVSAKSVNGAWGIGTLNDALYFSYGTDANYNAGTNTTNNYSIDANGNFSGKASNVTGTVAIDHGGTGATSKTAAGTNLGFNWSGQGGQPTWLWGGNAHGTYYVYNPSNFSVNLAAYATLHQASGSTTGTTAKAFSVPAAATEIIVTGRFSSKILSASIPKALLTSSNQEIWLTGGRGASSGSGYDGALRCLCYLKISSTTLTLQGITVNDQNVDKTSATTWNVFYR